MTGRQRVLRAVWPWLLTVGLLFALAAVTALIAGARWAHGWAELRHLWRLAIGTEQTHDTDRIVWRAPHALFLAAGAVVIGVVTFHLQRRHRAVLGFSRVSFIEHRGVWAWLSDVPGALRMLAVCALAIGLARPETFRTVTREIDTIDIILVVDMSKSMEDQDMSRDRLDAAQRVIRRFLRRNKNDRIGLVVFGQQAMLQCPLTQDMKLLEQIVSDLTIGDVPELGTAIGDGLALGLAQLRRSDAKSKVVILLSDGDSNWVTRFAPEEAGRQAAEQGVKVYTLLVGREESEFMGGMSVNPATLRNIATVTGGEFFRASDYASFDRGFQSVRSKLDTTKRTVRERIPDKQLFLPFALLALLLVGADMLLSYTRLRRLP